eukprot:NODE_170_length_14437_cov_1.447273.p12 type:complete len:132 gc:universal NODE_170_length_14437_cov_1.447273:4095-4490(+)
MEHRRNNSAQKEMRKILITFDCNDHGSDKLLQYAADHIIKPDEKIYLMTVIKGEAIQEQHKMDRAIQILPNAAPLLIMGDPREKILEVAREIGVDVIVMGSRHMKPVHKAIIGSVSSYVVNHSECSVFIVK